MPINWPHVQAVIAVPTVSRPIAARSPFVTAVVSGPTIQARFVMRNAVLGLYQVLQVDLTRTIGIDASAMMSHRRSTSPATAGEHRRERAGEDGDRRAEPRREEQRVRRESRPAATSSPPMFAFASCMPKLDMLAPNVGHRDEEGHVPSSGRTRGCVRR